MEPIAGGSVCNDPYTRMELSSLEEGRKGQFDKQSVAKLVHAELDLISVLSQTWWRSFSCTQNAGIAK
jgi:hypothetical protein